MYSSSDCNYHRNDNESPIKSFIFKFINISKIINLNILKKCNVQAPPYQN